MRRRPPALTVRGLVRLRERVRDQVGRGLSPAALLELRREVETAVSGVDRALGARGLGAAQLAAPTRNAYRDLKTLDFTALPTGEAALGGAMRLRGLGPAWDRLERRAAAASVAPPGGADAAGGSAGAAKQRASAEAIAAEAAAALARVEALVGPAAAGRRLPARTATVLDAFAALAAPGGGAALIDSLAVAGKAFAAALGEARGGRGLVLALRFRPTTAMWRIRLGRGRAEVTLSHVLVGAPEPVFAAMSRWALGLPAPGAREAAEAWVSTRGRRRGATPAGAGGARGLHHDLDPLFDELNRDHFSGRLDRPRLGWSAAPTFHRFGSYVFADDRVILSSSLDHPEVPRFVVASVLHHELLHKDLGLGGEGRRRAHTAEFRRRERLFPRHQEASDFLERLARRRRRG